MNYIVSSAKYDIIPKEKQTDYITIVTRKTHNVMRNIECSDYIRDLINYDNFTSPVVTWEDSDSGDVLSKYVMLSYETTGMDIIPYMNADIYTMIRACKNILTFLQANHITHTDINIKTLKMNKYSTHPILINFSNTIINKSYIRPEYNPTQHWRSPLYHLFCYIVNIKNETLTKDMASDIVSHISSCVFGMSLPIQYVTTIEELFIPYINKSRGYIIEMLLDKAPSWDIYSIHALIYEYSDTNEIKSKCKRYIIDRSVSIF